MPLDVNGISVEDCICKLQLYLPVVYFPYCHYTNRFFCCCHFVVLYLQNVMVSRAESLVDHSAGYLDKETII